MTALRPALRLAVADHEDCGSCRRHSHRLTMSRQNQSMSSDAVRTWTMKMRLAGLPAARRSRWSSGTDASIKFRVQGQNLILAWGGWWLAQEL